MSVLIVVGVLTCAYAFHFSATPPIHSQNEIGGTKVPSVQTNAREKIIAAVTPALVVNISFTFPKIR